METKEKLSTKTDRLLRRARAIIGRLKPENFTLLAKQMSELEVETEKELEDIVNMIYEVAIREPAYVVVYANMCGNLASVKVPSQTKKGEYVNFREILLMRCQKEFEKHLDSVERDLVKIRTPITEPQPNGVAEQTQQELEAVLEVEEENTKRRQMGNIRFIGDIFKLKMMTDGIIHDCVSKLLQSKKEESLECLCQLLAMTGLVLDTELAKARMETLFANIERIISEKEISVRLRFMLQDIVDLRRNVWTPKYNREKPKLEDSKWK